MQQQFPSQILEDAVKAFSSLPGVGRKTALRLSLFALREGKEWSKKFTDSISALTEHIKYCSVCHNIADSDICDICASHRRDHTTICVVESIKEVMLIENTGQYQGVYHVLGGLISPMNGVSPADLEIESLVNRIAEGNEPVKEIIMALSPNMEGDTTAFYIYRKLAGFDVSITTIARGVAVGDDLEYADEITLAKSITNRIKYNA